MMIRALQRGIASGWKQSSVYYGGRTWPLVVVMFSNFGATTLFGGGIMLLGVAAVETGYLAIAPTSHSWFTSEVSAVLTAYGFLSLLASAVPILATAGINKLYRRRCKTCGR